MRPPNRQQDTLGQPGQIGQPGDTDPMAGQGESEQPDYVYGTEVPPEDPFVQDGGSVEPLDPNKPRLDPQPKGPVDPYDYYLEERGLVGP